MNSIDKTVEVLRKGNVVLVPTDTNYALAADPWNVEACSKIYALKKRDIRKPLTLFISKPEDVWLYCDHSQIKVRDELKKLISVMPGPINLVLPKSHHVPNHEYIDNKSISIVCNKQPLLRKVIEQFGKPLALSSANLSGIEYEHLIDSKLAQETFGDRVGYVLQTNDNPTTTVSSTIVSVLGHHIETLRQGDIHVDELMSL